MMDDRLFFGDRLIEDAAPTPPPKHIKIHTDLIQGSDEWLAARCGMITASEMKLLLTPTLKFAENDKSRAHLFELVAQRVTGHVEPHYISDDMLRGQEDEYYAREYYGSRIAPVEECGFITNSKWGFTLGYSPDGLVGTDGLIECKSRRQRFAVQVTLENVLRDQGETIPADYLLQCQTGLLVSERHWIDLCIYSNGMHMAVIRVLPDARVQEAILEVCADAEERMARMKADYLAATRNPDAHRLIPTERRVVQEMHL